MTDRFPPPPWAADVDLAAEVAHGPDPVARSEAREWLGLIADLRRRHARHTRGRLDSDVSAISLRRQGLPAAVVATLIAAVMMGVAAFIHSAFWFHAAITSAAAAFLWFVAWIARSDAAVEELRAAASGAKCPFCGYDLTGVVPAVDEPPADAAGPARCTECGAAWPLLPPPTPLVGSTVPREPILPACVRAARP